jgi:hypothetical protein
MIANDPVLVGERLVLEGVPRLSFDPKPELEDDVELTPLPSAISTCLRYMGDDVKYRYLMGMTGDAFRLSWKEGWELDNVADIYVAPDLNKTCDLAFAAAGRAYEAHGVRPGDVPESVLRERIIATIRDKHQPVLAYGVVGPPEMCIIAGYDEGGDVLIGWSFFQNMPEFNAGVEFEPSGYFRKRNWHTDTWGIVIVGEKREKREKPPQEAMYRQALEWALHVMRTPSVYDPGLNGEAWKDRHSGHAAYDAWARHLLKDRDFPDGDMALLTQRYSVHDDASMVVAEGRWYASLFLSDAAQVMPHGASKLHEAASYFAREHELMWALWGELGGIGRGEKQIRALARPDVRRRIVQIIYEARDLDVVAALRIEQALAMPKLW